MENSIIIKQIITREWTGRDGVINTEIMGLGDDSLVYQWHKGTGKWVLNVLNHS
jgi:hypothetical protein